MKFILSLMSIILYTLFISSLVVSIAADKSSNSQFQSLSHEETIVSPNGVFELGFFPLGNSNKSYLAIRYKNYSDETFVWVANGSYPINDSSAKLTLHSSGSFVLTHNSNQVWSTSSLKVAQNPLAELLDSGNLVIREKSEANSEDKEEYLWQSFDYPSNTMLAGMKIGWDHKRKLNRRLIAWKSDDDPTPGELSWEVVLHPYPEIYMMRGKEKHHRLGPWNGLRFSGMPEMKPNPVFHYKFVSNEEEVTYMWTLQTSLITKVVLNQTSLERPRFVWSEATASWNFYSTMPGEYCDYYGVCGGNSFCSSTASPMCECLKGFKPKSPEKWNSMVRTQGCGLKSPLTCKSDGFAQVDGLKVPDTTNTSVYESIDLEKCRTKCLKDCSCMAYTNSNISGSGSGCVMWFGDLLDIKLYPDPESGQRLYIRLPPSELDSIRPQVSKIMYVISVAATIGVILAIYFLYRRKIYDKSKTKESIERQLKDVDVPLFDLLTIATATNNFLLNNKIGQGGFGPVGPVYKGKLVGGQEIAVKRLSSRSGEGITEFITEVKPIAKLQHRNLVKLLGCCIKGHEKLLVYEYMAWTLWKEHNALQLIDSSIKDSSVIPEVLRCIHVSLLCVQQYPEDRPTMTSVIQMLGGSEMDMFILTMMSSIPYILFVSSLVVSIAADTSSISQSQSLSFGKTIVSPSGTFELGFFHLGNPNKSYLGIWFKNIPSRDIVWVANGGNPINNSSALLSLKSSGHLVLTHNNTVVWSTSSLKEAINPVANLLDSGNLVIRDENAANQEAYLWQSFDYPSDTMVSGMKIGWDLKRNLSIHLSAWKSADDPTPGDFTWGIILHPYPEMYLMKGNKKYQRVGPWNGLQFSGGRPKINNPVYLYKFVSNKEEIYYEWTLKNASLLSKLVVNQTAQDRSRYVWSETTKSWWFYSTRPEDPCDHYGICGANEYCSPSVLPMCECLKGYKPESPEKWNSMDRTQGCVLKHPLSCKDDGFAPLDWLKVPDTKRTYVDESIDLEQCKTKCLKDCSCMAYTNTNISGAGSGCVMWFGELFDIKLFPDHESGQRLYIRLPPSELESNWHKKISKIVNIITFVAATLGGILAIFFIYRRNVADKSKTKESIERQLEDVDVPLFNLLTITIATNNFLLKNKIGQGGFGPVYKGKLEGGQEIAVKRLSSRSGQGLTEFITEVKLIAKLQHRNLVKLLGCCIKGKEKLLVYEYMAWTLWKEQNALQLIDSSIKDSCVISEVLRCIHVSLLCVQQYPEDRPTMTSVIQMLGSEMDMVEPKEPGFFPRRILKEGNLCTNLNQVTSNDELSITFTTPIIHYSLPSSSGSCDYSQALYSMKFILTVTSFILYILFVSSLVVSIAADTSSISQSQSLSFGRTIVSPNGVFELGFFNLGNPNKSYLGIWFKNIPSQNIVWVANGGNPINDSFALLSLNSSGHLVLTHNNTVVWSTSSLRETQNPVAKLLDSGNLVIRDENEVIQEAYLWQSFDYPSNTGLSGMKIGWYLKRNLSIHLTAWKSDDDPTPGDFTWGIILHPYPEIYLMKGTKKYYRVGPWNGSPGLINSIYYHEFVSDEEELSFTWNLKNASFLSKVVVNQTTQERPRYVWSETESWMLYSTRPEDYCDHYGVCGANAYCSSTASPICECLKGYTPKSPEKWKSMDRTQGCVLKHPLSCKYDGFAQVDGLKVPDTKRTHVDQTLDIEKCRTKCLNDCSCMAYTNYNISGAGSGCVMWFGDLLDIKLYSVAESGRRLHIRLPPSELESIKSKKNSKIIIGTSVAAALGVVLAICFIHRRNIADKSKTKKSNDRQLQDVDVPLFDLLTITAATDNFLLNNKIGEGGFGPVYKGKLEGGQEIAVKRLSSRSGQGITEFITEVKLIAKLQHRNLVKLLGCCIKGQEELLVYEYVAWALWKEQNALQLIDSGIKDSCVIPEVLRCIHVSLLCVQQYPEDRPTMTSVIQMLGSEMDMVEPKEPGFFPRRILKEGNLKEMTSNDELTISLFSGR
ncbi:Receptor-like serine/threonine-protein kinase SD1-8 [Glycine max]|nr:Receptor-like serine/threonine-protein kinase SD1-8 [Glycine max]